MNNISLTGRVLSKGQYKLNENTGEYEFRFHVSCYIPLVDQVKKIPCMCKGWLADESFSKMCENAYVEVEGCLDVSGNNKLYVLCNSVQIKRPRAKREFYIRSTDFLQYYKPNNILERIANAETKKKN